MQMDPGGGPPAEITTPLPPSQEGQTPEPEAQSEGSKGASHWFDRVIRRGSPGRNDGEQPPDPEPRTSPTPPPAWRPPQTPEELDRVVQSRTDAELYRREQLQQQRTLSALEQQKEQALADDDPLLVTELERQIRGIKAGDQAQNQVTQVVGSVSDFYDHLFLDTYLGKVDAATRQELLKEPIVGAQGRALLAERIATALYEQGVKVGEQKADERLRKNPSFRKEVLHEVRPDQPEPDGLSGIATSGGASDMDDIIRGALRR